MIARPRALLTPRDLAAALGVSESSAKRWADDGRVAVSRTAGGHRRIALGDALRFAREARLPVVDPGALGLDDVLPARGEVGRGGQRAAENLAESLHAAFLLDDPRVAGRLLVGAYLAGETAAEICDGPIREALARVGECWHHGEEGILIEHRAVDTCLQALAFIRSLTPVPELTAPIALGGAIAGDPYALPSLAAAVVVAAAGFRDVNLGPALPSAALREAVARYEPSLVWRTASIPIDPGSLAEDLEPILAALPPGASVVVGGRGVPEEITLPERAYALRSMSELAAFAHGVAAARGRA